MNKTKTKMKPVAQIKKEALDKSRIGLTRKGDKKQKTQSEKSLKMSINLNLVKEEWKDRLKTAENTVKSRNSEKLSPLN